MVFVKQVNGFKNDIRLIQSTASLLPFQPPNFSPLLRRIKNSLCCILVGIKSVTNNFAFHISKYNNGIYQAALTKHKNNVSAFLSHPGNNFYAQTTNSTLLIRFCSFCLFFFFLEFYFSPKILFLTKLQKFAKPPKKKLKEEIENLKLIYSKSRYNLLFCKTVFVQLIILSFKILLFCFIECFFCLFFL